MEHITDWIRNQIIDPNLIWKEGITEQVLFFRDRIAKDIFGTDDCYVVSTHTSKSCFLPVVRIRTDDKKLWIRNNFYNHVVSIESTYPIRRNTSSTSLKYFANNVSDLSSFLYAEGFKDEFTFGTHEEDPKQFTFVFNGTKYQLYSFLESM